jgi:hypothetical protein
VLKPKSSSSFLDAYAFLIYRYDGFLKQCCLLDAHDDVFPEWASEIQLSTINIYRI